MSRFARSVPVYFFEEPVQDGDWVGLQASRPADTNVTVLTPHLGNDLSFDERNRILKRLLNQFLISNDIHDYIAWYYTPMALNFTSDISPIMTIYDCMDELSNFRFAPPELVKLEHKLFELSDLIFTGGRSLYEAKRHRHPHVFAFPSSIDKEHFLRARIPTIEPVDQRDIPHPRLGFYGVLDERIDYELIAEIAELREQWQIVLIGPVVKVDPAILPRKANIHYIGSKDYNLLPFYVASWDIAIMPFAINDATKYISPTKTPEFLAAGKPVVSTAITDVVNDYAKYGLVSICNTAEEFVDECEHILTVGRADNWLEIVDQHLSENSWDNTWSKMTTIMADTMEEKKVLTART